MARYRLLLASAVLLFPLSTAAAESAATPDRGAESPSVNAPEQGMAPLEAAPKHHHHHKHQAKEDAPAQDAPPAEAAPVHHHHHKHPAEESEVSIGQSPDDKAEHEHHMMDMEKKGHIHHEFEHQHHMMDMDADGMVMNENTDELPRDCPKLAGDVKITVRAGTKYAEKFPGTVFGYDQHQWNVEPCTRVTVTLINEDNIRHQWMMHMLPKYIYPQGMFHIEVSGPGRRTGTFIVPSTEKTYFVHCDIAQHTEKGMKAQLKVGSGDQDFPSIPGITAPNLPDSYATEISWSTIGSSLGAGVAGLALAMFGLGRVKRKAEIKGVEGVSPVQRQSAMLKNVAPKTKRQRWWPFGNK